MRIYLKSEYSSEEDISKAKQEEIIPKGLPIRIDPETGLKYFIYQFRYSFDINWEKIAPYVECLSNKVKMFCDLIEEGIYEDEKKIPGIKVIVILKRNEASGVTWEEAEIYGKGVDPEDMKSAHYFLRTRHLKLSVKWSSGIPHQ
jgi:hypothetical protein